MNVLEIVQQACYNAGITPPSSLISQTDSQVLQYINQFYAECRALRARRWWPQLKRKAFIVLVDGQQSYQLPQDFFASIPNTQWDINNKWYDC